MSNEKDKKIAQKLRNLADEIDPPVNKISKLPEPETTEAAQEKHENALISFQTEQHGGMNLSLNSLDQQKPKDDEPTHAD